MQEQVPSTQEEDNVHYPQVIDTALLNETQDSQIAQFPIVQQIQEETSSNNKSILALLILYTIASSVGVFVLIVSIVNSIIVKHSLSNSIPELYYAAILLLFAVFGFVGILIRNNTYACKIIFAISTSLGLFFVATNSYFMLVLALSRASWVSIIVNITVFTASLIQLGCSIYLTVMYGKMDSKKFNATNINISKQTHSKRINIAIIVIESVALLVSLSLFGFILYSMLVNRSSPLYPTVLFFIFLCACVCGTPLIGLISSIVQLKTHSKIAAGVTMGATLFPLLFILPFILLLLVNLFGLLDHFEYSSASVAMLHLMSPGTGWIDGLLYLVLLTVVFIVFVIIIPNLIVFGLPLALLILGKSQAKF